MAGSVGVQPDELIYVNKVENVKYSVCERGGTTTLKVKNMTAVYDAATDAIAFTDAKGKVLLKEISHGRTMRESEVQGEATTAVAQRSSRLQTNIFSVRDSFRMDMSMCAVFLVGSLR